MKAYLFWDNGNQALPEAFLAPDRHASMRRFETHVAKVMSETTEETRGFLKGNSQVRAYVEGSATELNYMGFRLAEVELKEYK